ncbi:acyl-CoA dehydrogenase family protein [Nocardia miyunensis]|uniref:acyl-CoA dehydrogenase family protein n=1 Tax=Nocardia miyunensis TaxID=282684 RepID=UPI0008340E77|nr:acyl-CoA dehydrogenase family protein [Nocardia miyunensis]
MLTEEQEYLRETVRKLLAERASRDSVPAPDASADYDRELWAVMAQQVGLHGLAIAEEFGGAGYGPMELAVAFEEMGAVLLDAPFFASVGLAATVIQATGDRSVCAEYLPGIGSGDLVGALAFTEAHGCWDESEIQLAATKLDDSWLLYGQKRYVVHAHVADFFVVAARTARGVSLFLVDAGAAGVEVTAHDALDPTRPLAAIRFAAAPARLIGEEGAGWPALRQAFDLATVYLAAEELGGAARCLDMCVGYAKSRMQFGRPIGSFQAIKHKCADMLVAVEMARSAALSAADAAASERPDAAVLASLAKAVCSESFVYCATETIQIHGGIGFTWEHPAHLYYKRSRGGEVLLGSPQRHRELLVARAAPELPL